MGVGSKEQVEASWALEGGLGSVGSAVGASRVTGKPRMAGTREVFYLPRYELAVPAAAQPLASLVSLVISTPTKASWREAVKIAKVNAISVLWYGSSAEILACQWCMHQVVCL